VTDPAALSARYGRTPERHRRRRLIAIAAGIGGALALVAWLVFGSGILRADATIDTRNLGFENLDENANVRVRFELSIDPGTAAECAVQAVDADYGTVGWKVLDVPASTERTRSFDVELRTTARAESGLIYRCWVP
jgi:hypothetical protein